MPPITRVKQCWAALLAAIVLSNGGCHYTATNVVRGHYFLAPSLYHHCPKCGQFTAKGLPHSCKCACEPGYAGYQATCWRAWPSDWMRCPPPNAGACEAAPENLPTSAMPETLQPQQPLVTPTPIPDPIQPAPIQPAISPAVPNSIPSDVVPNTPASPPAIETKLPSDDKPLPPPPPAEEATPPVAIPRQSFIPQPINQQPIQVAPASDVPVLNDAKQSTIAPIPQESFPNNFYETIRNNVSPPAQVPTPALPPALIYDSKGTQGQRAIEYQAKKEVKKSVLVAPKKSAEYPSLNPAAVEPAPIPVAPKQQEPTKPEVLNPVPTKHVQSSMSKPAAPAANTKFEPTTKFATSNMPNALTLPTFKPSSLNAAKVMEAPRNMNPATAETMAAPVKATEKSTVPTVSTTPVTSTTPRNSGANSTFTSRSSRIPAMEAKLSSLAESPKSAKSAKLTTAHVECVEPVLDTK